MTSTVSTQPQTTRRWTLSRKIVIGLPYAFFNARGDLRLGVPSAPYFIRKAKAELPNADIVPVERMMAQSTRCSATGSSGRMRRPRKPRWSIARNVLHWGQP